MITANCRDRFTAEDFDFVVQTLAHSERDYINLVDLLTDTDTRDAILDHPRDTVDVLSALLCREPGPDRVVSPAGSFHGAIDILASR